MILMNDFAADPPELRQAMHEAFSRVVGSGWYVLGKEVEAFEKRWAEACGVNHGVGVGNGMDAIEIALRSLGIGPGDEVITTPMTAFATVLAILRAGATPVLADIDPRSALLDTDSVRRCLTGRTKAVILVHLYGQVRQMGAWLDLCSEAGIELVEDCAQAHFAQWQGRMAGSFGRVGAFSFYPTKNLGAIGDGGMLVTSDEGIAKYAMSCRNYGQSERYHHPILGMNSRLDELQAAILMQRVEWLEVMTKRRRTIAQAYRDGIKNPLVVLLDAPETDLAHVHHLFVLKTKCRDGLQRHLRDHGIQTLIHYPVPVHKQEPCLALRRDPLGLKNCELHAETCLSLPCAPHLKDAEIDQVIDAVNQFAA